MAEVKVGKMSPSIMRCAVLKQMRMSGVLSEARKRERENQVLDVRKVRQLVKKVPVNGLARCRRDDIEPFRRVVR